MTQEICCFVFIWDEMMAVFYVNGTVLFLVWKLFHSVAPDSRATIFPTASLLYFSCCMFFLLFFAFDTWHYVFQNNPPMSTHSFPFISHCTKIPHTQQKLSTNVIFLFSYFYFVCFEWASSHTLGNRNHFTFFPRSFSLFSFFFLSFFRLLYFIILTELLLASIKLPIFCCISFCGGWKKKRNMEGGLQRNSIFQCLNKFIIDLYF